jgi:hypothetical protein
VNLLARTRKGMALYSSLLTAQAVAECFLVLCGAGISLIRVPPSEFRSSLEP